MPDLSRVVARLALAAESLRGVLATEEELPTVPWQPGPERYAVEVPGSDGPTVSLYPDTGQVGVSTGDSLRKCLRDPKDGGQNWYFLELYDHMCPHCWYAVPVVNDLAGAYQGTSNWRMTSLNCHMRQNAEVCYFLEVISGAVDYPTFLLCPAPDDAEQFSTDDLPERAKDLFDQLDGEQRDTFMELVRCRIRYEKDEQADQSLFLSAQSMAGWLQQQTSLEALHPEMLTKGADFVDSKDIRPRDPPGEPGWLKEDKPGEPGVPAFDPGDRWYDAIRGFVNTLYHGYRPSRHDAAVSSSRILSRSFPIKGQELSDLADKLEKNGKFQDINKFKELLVEWANSNDIGADPSDEEAENYATCEPAHGSNCVMWTLLHVTLTAVASRGLSSRPLFSDEGSLVGKNPDSFVKIEEALRFVRDYVEAFLSCAECKKQFLDDYDSCRYGQCDIKNYRDLPLWLWRVHNAVSMRVALQHSSGVDRRWPMYPDCPKCWKDELVLEGARRLRSSTISVATPVAFVHNKTRLSRRLSDTQFSVEDLDAPFDTSRVFWHMVRSYISIQRVAFELNDLSPEEQEIIDRVVEVERSMAQTGKLPKAHTTSKSSEPEAKEQEDTSNSPVLLMFFLIAGCILCALCGLACVMGQIKERPSRAPTFRTPINEMGGEGAEADDVDGGKEAHAAE